MSSDGAGTDASPSSVDPDPASDEAVVSVVGDDSSDDTAVVVEGAELGESDGPVGVATGTGVPVVEGRGWSGTGVSGKKRDQASRRRRTTSATIQRTTAYPANTNSPWTGVSTWGPSALPMAWPKSPGISTVWATKRFPAVNGR